MAYKAPNEDDFFGKRGRSAERRRKWEAAGGAGGGAGVLLGGRGRGWPPAAVRREGGFLSRPGRPGAEPPGLAVSVGPVPGRASGHCVGRTARRAVASLEHGGAAWTLLCTRVHIRYPSRLAAAPLGSSWRWRDLSWTRASGAERAGDWAAGRPGAAGPAPCPSAGRSSAGADVVRRGSSLVREEPLPGDCVPGPGQAPSHPRASRRVRGRGPWTLL